MIAAITGPNEDMVSILSREHLKVVSLSRGEDNCYELKLLNPEVMKNF